MSKNKNANVNTVDIFVTAMRGTELALKEELREIGFRGAVADRGGARIKGELQDAFRVCLHSRIGVRVLFPVGDFEAPTPEALYEGIADLEWEQYLDADSTVSVSCVSRDSLMHNTNFIALKTKDAIVDRLRDKLGARPSVDREDADVAIFVHLKKDHAKVFVDASGDSLHKRGYRLARGEAPIKETLAAAIVRMSGWDGQSPLVDPTCGSGTIAIEADAWARRVAPGLHRPRFGIERWRTMDEKLARRFADLREDAANAQVMKGPDVFGSDVDAEALEAAAQNAKRVRSTVRFSRARLGDLKATNPAGTVIANLPYGERIDATPGFYNELHDAVSSAREMRFALLLGGPPPEGVLPPPSALHALWNGPIECRLAIIDPQRMQDFGGSSRGSSRGRR